MSKVILITGVSSGFGRSCAELLAGNGHVVYGTVRQEAEKENTFRLLKMDLTDHSSISNAVSKVIDEQGRIDIVINNAGMHTGGPAETTPESHLRLQIETSFTGMVTLTREVLPFMRKQGGGIIINISSIGGLMGLPFQAYYSAAKFAVEGFSEALRMELRSFNIKVVVINPGDFRTSNSANRRSFLAPSAGGDPYHEQFLRSLDQIEKDEAEGWKPEVLAKRMVKIVNSKRPRQRYVIASFEQKLAVVLKYILPGKLFSKILEEHYRIR